MVGTFLLLQAVVHSGSYYNVTANNGTALLQVRPHVLYPAVPAAAAPALDAHYDANPSATLVLP